MIARSPEFLTKPYDSCQEPLPACTKNPLYHLVNLSAMTPRAAEGAANAVGKKMIIAQNSNCLSNDLCMGLLLSKE